MTNELKALLKELRGPIGNSSGRGTHFTITDDQLHAVVGDEGVEFVKQANRARRRPEGNSETPDSPPVDF